MAAADIASVVVAVLGTGVSLRAARGTAPVIVGSPVTSTSGMAALAGVAEIPEFIRIGWPPRHAVGLLRKLARRGIERLVWRLALGRVLVGSVVVLPGFVVLVVPAVAARAGIAAVALGPVRPGSVLVVRVRILVGSARPVLAA